MQRMHKQIGFSIVELLVVLAIVSIMAAFAIPTLSGLQQYRVQNDARSISGQITQARMRASAYFARAEILCTTSTRTCVIETEKNGDTAFTTETTSTIVLSAGVSFAIPSGVTVGVGGQSSATPTQGSTSVTPPFGTIAVTFNSRGLPVNRSTTTTSSLVTDYAIYLKDTKSQSFAIAVDASGTPSIYRLNGSTYAKVSD